MTNSEQLDQLFTALASAQAEMHNAIKGDINPFFKSKYADNATIINASRESLTKYGLSVSHIIKDGEFITILAHKSGQYMVSTVKMFPSKLDIQAYGAHITYLRRYIYAAIVGLAISDATDDDGEADMNREPEKKEKPKNNKYITEKQAADILECLQKCSNAAILLKDIYAEFNIETISDIPHAKYGDTLRHIELEGIVKK